MAQAPNGATGIGCSWAHAAPLGVLWDLCPAIHGLTPLSLPTKMGCLKWICGAATQEMIDFRFAE